MQSLSCGEVLRELLSQSLLHPPGATELMLNTELSLEQQEHLHTLQICSRVLLTTINDLLDLGMSSTHGNVNILRHVRYDAFLC